MVSARNSQTDFSCSIIPIYRNEGVNIMKKRCYTNIVFDLRTANNLSQDQLAKDLGVCRRTISLIENDEQNLSLDLAYRISAYFNLLVNDVFPPSGHLIKSNPSDLK